MRKIFFWLAIMFFLSPSAYSFGFSSKEDCSKCHTLKKEEAQELLKGMGQNVKVLDIHASPLKALWEVDIEADGKKALAYVDFTKKYLISGSIIEIRGKKNLTHERFMDLNRVDVSQIPLGDAIVMGSKDAKNKVVVFDDPD